MRITHLATTLAGGAGIGLWRYHRALRSQGVDSRILVMSPPVGTEGEVGKVLWRKRSLPFRLAQRFGLVRTNQERLRSKIATLDRQVTNASYELFSLPYSDYCPEDHPWVAEADVINLHWVAGILDWPRFLSRVRLPLVLTLHDQQPYLGGFHYELDAENNPHLVALDRHVRDIKRHALPPHVAVVANSEWNAARARASGFYPANTLIETFLYPLDRSHYCPIPDARSRMELSAGKLIIGFACENLANPRKGFAGLLAALLLLPAGLRDRLQLLSFGRAPDSASADATGLPWRHLGFLADDETKSLAYSAMDVFVAPSRAEAFGLTAIEAQACGIPVVAAPVGGLAEAVAEPLPLPAGQPAAPADLAAGLVHLLENPDLRRQHAARGLALVRDRHNPATIGAQLAAFFSRFVSTINR